jgi:hypothetical protein
MARFFVMSSLLLCACGEALKPFTVVDRLRIAGVANEPVQPTPGQNFNVNMLTLRAADDETPLTVLATACVSVSGGQACGPGDPEMPYAGLPTETIQTAGDQNTGARENGWTFTWPQGAFGIGLVNIVVVNCATPDQLDTVALTAALVTLAEEGAVAAPAGWSCAEDPLRLSKSVWLARHLMPPVMGDAPSVTKAVLHVPLMVRTEDQTELEAGLVRTALTAPFVGQPSTDEARWFWFSTSPRGVVMRVTASEEGANTALVDAERSTDYSYWAVMRDQMGRVAWSHFRLDAQDEITAP